MDLTWLRGKDSNLRPLGYEPNSLATDVPRDNMVPHERIELPYPDYKTGVMPLY
jgi:hypothetical protein